MCIVGVGSAVSLFASCLAQQPAATSPVSVAKPEALGALNEKVLSVANQVLATGSLDCDVAPTQPGPNQIQLRFTVRPPCDLEQADANVVFDEAHLVLAHDRVTRGLYAGVSDSFDSSPFYRPVAGAMLSAELRGTCKGGKPFTATDQCRVK